MKIDLPLTREEILALDSMIRDGAASRFPLSTDERIALSVWNGATQQIHKRGPISISRAKDALESWFMHHKGNRF